jgi:Zn finger protein HypA/HybF involved in hydrogenase expression
MDFNRNAQNPEKYAPVENEFWDCPDCGGRNPEVNYVCRDCGQPVRHTEEPTPFGEGEKRNRDISFQCNQCGQHMEIDEAGAGLTIQCPKCGQNVTVPSVQSVAKPLLQDKKGGKRVWWKEETDGAASPLPNNKHNAFSAPGVIIGCLLILLGVHEYMTQKPKPLYVTGWHVPSSAISRELDFPAQYLPPDPILIAVYRASFSAWMLGGTILILRSVLPRRTFLRGLFSWLGGVFLGLLVATIWTFGAPVNPIGLKGVAGTIGAMIGMLFWPAVFLLSGFWMTLPRRERRINRVVETVYKLRDEEKSVQFCPTCHAVGRTGWLELRRCSSCGGKGYVVSDVEQVGSLSGEVRAS